ncbi:MAG: hypothetical protein MR473_10730 [Clostridiales bacterium]|nr:hypothetical protein [Clostridiales bacterium]
MKTGAKEIALCGVLAALGVSVMALGGLFPMAAYCCPVLVMLMLVPVLGACGRRMAWAWYFAVAVLSCLLCPNVEASALFVCLGYYPIVQRDLNRIRLGLLRVLAKTVLFNGAIAIMYLVLVFVLGLGEIAEEMGQAGLILTLATVAIGNVTFWLTDLLLSRLGRLLHRKGM